MPERNILLITQYANLFGKFQTYLEESEELKTEKLQMTTIGYDTLGRAVARQSGTAKFAAKSARKVANTAVISRTGFLRKLDQAIDNFAGFGRQSKMDGEVSRTLIDQIDEFNMELRALVHGTENRLTSINSVLEHTHVVLFSRSEVVQDVKMLSAPEILSFIADLIESSTNPVRMSLTWRYFIGTLEVFDDLGGGLRADLHTLLNLAEHGFEAGLLGHGGSSNLLKQFIGNSEDGGIILAASMKHFQNPQAIARVALDDLAGDLDRFLIDTQMHHLLDQIGLRKKVIRPDDMDRIIDILGLKPSSHTRINIRNRIVHLALIEWLNNADPSAGLHKIVFYASKEGEGIKLIRVDVAVRDQLQMYEKVKNIVITYSGDYSCSSKMPSLRGIIKGDKDIPFNMRDFMTTGKTFQSAILPLYSTRQGSQTAGLYTKWWAIARGITDQVFFSRRREKQIEKMEDLIEDYRNLNEFIRISRHMLPEEAASAPHYKLVNEVVNAIFNGDIAFKVGFGPLGGKGLIHGADCVKKTKGTQLITVIDNVGNERTIVEFVNGQLEKIAENGKIVNKTGNIQKIVVGLLEDALSSRLKGMGHPLDIPFHFHDESLIGMIADIILRYHMSEVIDETAGPAARELAFMFQDAMTEKEKWRINWDLSFSHSVEPNYGGIAKRWVVDQLICFEKTSGADKGMIKLAALQDKISERTLHTDVGNIGIGNDHQFRNVELANDIEKLYLWLEGKYIQIRSTLNAYDGILFPWGGLENGLFNNQTSEAIQILKTLGQKFQDGEVIGVMGGIRYFGFKNSSSSYDALTKTGNITQKRVPSEIHCYMDIWEPRMARVTDALMKLRKAGGDYQRLADELQGVLVAINNGLAEQAEKLARLLQHRMFIVDDLWHHGTSTKELADQLLIAFNRQIEALNLDLSHIKPFILNPGSDLQLWGEAMSDLGLIAGFTDPRWGYGSNTTPSH